MKPEYEARFPGVDHDTIRALLRRQGAACTRPRQLLKRVIFENQATADSRSWLRLRTDGETTTLTLKRATGTTPGIDTVLESEIEVDSFETAQRILQELGLAPVRYQENYREEWHLGPVTYDLDEWPGLHPFLEIEGPDPGTVETAAKQLGLDFAEATFGSVDELYLKQAGIDILGQPRLAFTGQTAQLTDPAET
jgi:adenylate cyclase class 2